MKFLQGVLAALAVVAFSVQPSLAQGLVEGKQYVRLQMPQPTESAGKVEVVEFFWYGCPHCADLDPLLKIWLKKLPADVSFRKVPAIFRDSWVPGAKLFYALEAMGLNDKLNDAVFNATHKDRINLNDEKILLDWIAKQGVDRQKFADMYKSFAVNAKVKRAAEMTQEYGFGGVPVLIVGGKYMPAPNLGTFGDMLAVVDGLIAKNRGELKK
jgi:thiol:disulfide interchange protein DsbA